MSKKLTVGNQIAIAIGLLLALIIVGSEFWQALITGAAADCIYAFFKGLLLVCVLYTVIWPYILRKVSCGQICGNQTHVTGWYNPVPVCKAYVDVGALS